MKVFCLCGRLRAATFFSLRCDHKSFTDFVIAGEAT